MRNILIGLSKSPLVWGGVATFAFYFALDAGLLRSETLVRYCAGHPVEYATTAMFWIGLCDLFFKFARTFRERRELKRGALFPPKRSEREPISAVDGYLTTLDKARAVRGESTRLTRLGDALSFLKFGGSPDDLDQELRFLADDDFDRRESEYGMVKTFIWAIPILGFLGTVLGITLALGSLDLTHIESTGETLAAGLKVAFDTTALALTLVFVLYFALFFVRKEEGALADRVGRLVDAELRGRFASADDETGDDRRSILDLTRQTTRRVAESFEEATRTQTALWSEAAADVARRSAELSNDAAARLGAALETTLRNAVESWSAALADAQSRFVAETLRPALEETAKSSARFEKLETAVARQTEALGAVLRTSIDVSTLEERLALNLERVADVGAFEKTLANLSATVCLLNSRLTGLSSGLSTGFASAAAGSDADVPGKTGTGAGIGTGAGAKIAVSATANADDEAERRDRLARKRAEAFAALDALESDLAAATSEPEPAAKSESAAESLSAAAKSESTPEPTPLVFPNLDAAPEADAQPSRPRARLGQKRSA